MDITVREAIQADQPFLKQMLWEAVIASPTLTEQIGLENIKKHEDQHWTNWLLNPDPALIAINQDQLPVGALLFLPNQETDSWQLGMGVVAQARGQGVGRKLIEAAVSFAHKRKFSCLTLLVDPINKTAIHLYQQAGFSHTGEKQGLLAMKLLV